MKPILIANWRSRSTRSVVLVSYQSEVGLSSGDALLTFVSWEAEIVSQVDLSSTSPRIVEVSYHSEVGLSSKAVESSADTNYHSEVEITSF